MAGAFHKFIAVRAEIEVLGRVTKMPRPGELAADL